MHGDSSTSKLSGKICLTAEYGDLCIDTSRTK
jgi:hypothetical protein